LSNSTFAQDVRGVRSLILSAEKSRVRAPVRPEMAVLTASMFQEVCICRASNVALANVLEDSEHRPERQAIDF
jgi:hypothetical protein